MDIEKYWYYVLTTFFFTLLITGFLFLLSSKPIMRYYLDGNESGNSLRVRVDIEFSQDNFIPVSGLSHFEAARLVDSLNTELLKHKRISE